MDIHVTSGVYSWIFKLPRPVTMNIQISRDVVIDIVNIH